MCNACTLVQIQYDLVVAAHTLGDLPTPKLRRLSIASLWRKTKQFLVNMYSWHFVCV